MSGALGPHTGASFVDALLERTSDSFNYIVLPEHCAADFDHPIRCIIDATRSSYPQLANFADVEALTAIATRSGLDNTKKYISSKLRTAVFNHVLVHLHRRVRASMHSRKIDDDTEVEGMMDMFMSGSTKRNVTVYYYKTSLPKVVRLPSTDHGPSSYPPPYQYLGEGLRPITNFPT